MSTLNPNEPATDAGESEGMVISMPTHTFRARMFWRSLSPTRRAEITRRARFRNQPHLRPANQTDPDDLLP